MKEEINIEKALAKLLIDNVLFANGRKVSRILNPSNGQAEEWDSMTFLYVTCNDLFIWACADSEVIAYDEILNLYNFHIDPANKGWGSDKWCCIKRNEQPQDPIKKSMIEDGVWDKVMENLPVNSYEKH